MKEVSEDFRNGTFNCFADGIMEDGFFPSPERLEYHNFFPAKNGKEEGDENDKEELVWPSYTVHRRPSGQEQEDDEENEV